MARPAKTLIAHVTDRTFRPSRHAGLLDREELPTNVARPLRELQERYRSTASTRVRAAIAVEFSEAVRAGGAGRRLSGSEAILAQVGPIQLGFDEAGGVEEWFALDEAWQVWDREHGALWRRLHGVALETDEQSGARAPALVDNSEALAEEEWPPDPPGLLLVGR